MSQPHFSFCIIMLLLIGFSGQSQNAILKRQTLSSLGSSIAIEHNELDLIVQQSIGQSSPINSTNSLAAIQGFIQPSVYKTNTAKLAELEASIFPNPFDHSIYIEFKEQQLSPINVTILDISGRLVHDQNFHISNSERIELNQLELGSGSYIITLFSDNKSFSSILIKS